MKGRKLLVTGMAILLVLGASGMVRADTAAIGFSGVSSDLDNWGDQGAITGFSFQPTSDISVTQLGIFDADMDGLLESHMVGIFDSNRNNLGYTTVPSMSNDGSSYFLYASLSTPIALSSGETYYIFSDTGNEPYTWNMADFEAASDITFLGDTSIWGWFDLGGDIPGTLGIFPDPNVADGNGIVGPNFMYAPIPIPGAFWLLGSGLVGLVGLRKRIRKAQ